MNYIYPAVFYPDGDAYTVKLPDFPEGVTCGKDTKEAAAMARDLLALLLRDRVVDGKDIPLPTSVETVDTSDPDGLTGGFVVMIDCEHDYKHGLYGECEGGELARLFYKGYTGTVEFSAEDNCYFGRVNGIKSLISYESEDIHDLGTAFAAAINDYLASCEGEGSEPEEPPKDLNYYMMLPYRVEIVEDKQEGGYALHCPDLTGCITCADTIEQGLSLIADAKRNWFTACLREGIVIPEPGEEC